MRPARPWYQSQTKTQQEKYDHIPYKHWCKNPQQNASKPHSAGLYIMIKWNLFLEGKNGSTFKNQFNLPLQTNEGGRKTTWLSQSMQKKYEKIQHPFKIKTLDKLGIEGSYLNII